MIARWSVILSSPSKIEFQWNSDNEMNAKCFLFAIKSNICNSNMAFHESLYIWFSMLNTEWRFCVETLFIESFFLNKQSIPFALDNNIIYFNEFILLVWCVPVKETIFFKITFHLINKVSTELQNRHTTKVSRKHFGNLEYMGQSKTKAINKDFHV